MASNQNRRNSKASDAYFNLPGSKGTPGKKKGKIGVSRIQSFASDFHEDDEEDKHETKDIVIDSVVLQN